MEYQQSRAEDGKVNASITGTKSWIRSAADAAKNADVGTVPKDV
jgi:hypothetical protein